MSESKAPDEVTGTIERLACQKPQFCAGRLNADGQIVSFSVKGYVRPGDHVTLTGEWENDPKWGRQFKASRVNVALPTTADGLTKWLQWNVLKVGPVTAQRMVDEFGTGLMDRCASDAESVAIFAKLPIETVEEIAKKWQNDRNKINALTYLAGLDLTQRQCEAIIRKFGTTAVTVVQEDPYQLLGRVEGFGWVNTDAIAKKLDICGDDPRRLRGALTAVVREAYERGSTCLNSMQAVRIATEKLAMRDPEPISRIVDDTVTRGDLKRFGGGTEATDYLAAPWAYKCESFVWRTLERSRDPNPFGCNNDEDAKEHAEYYRQLGTLTLDDKQIEAVAMAIRYRISVLTGSAGSGKTAISKAIVRYFVNADVQVYLAAPTGKAARRMAEVIGRPASTIHRLLQFNGGTGMFEFGEHNQFNDCIILVDEASMCDSEISYRLLSAIGPRCAVIFVGDPYQLSPVGPGSLLRDIIAHNLAPVVKLERCHRQAGSLKENSVAILSGNVAPTVMDEEPSPWMVNYKIQQPSQVLPTLKALYEKYLPQWGFHPIDETQFMTAKHDGGFGTKRLNLLLQYLHQNAIGNAIPEPTPEAHEERAKFYVGDKVIQTRNDYDLNVMNGEVGIIRAIDLNRQAVRQFMNSASPVPVSDLSAEQQEKVFGDDMRRMRNDKPVVDFVIDFPDRRVFYPQGTGGSVELAYCLSVHKCQGSQFPCSIVFVVKSAAFMQSRSWLYTSVTRAQKTSVIIGDEEGIRRAAQKVIVDERVTLLRTFSLVEDSRP